jgi:hypothetical protein
MQPTKTIVRMEHPSDGFGPFRSITDNWEARVELHTQHDEIMSVHKDMTKFPNLCNDRELRDKLGNNSISDYFFAFNSLEQFNVAFTTEQVKEFITELGFQVLTLEVTDYIESPFQTIYKKESIVSQTDISTLFL